MIPALLGIGATLLIALVTAAVAYGRNVAASVALTGEVIELRATSARMGERIGNCEGAIRALEARLNEKARA